jgi:hypothetical protein
VWFSTAALAPNFLARLTVRFSSAQLDYRLDSDKGLAAAFIHGPGELEQMLLPLCSLQHTNLHLVIQRTALLQELANSVPGEWEAWRLLIPLSF